MTNNFNFFVFFLLFCLSPDFSIANSSNFRSSNCPFARSTMFSNRFFISFLCRSRKRRTSFYQDSDMYLNSFRGDEQMDECNAALVLMSLSGSPHSPRQWMLASSPGSSSASWTSGSDELSDEGITNTGAANQNSSNRLRTASLSTSDEGIVMDYSDETPRKSRVSK